MARFRKNAAQIFYTDAFAGLDVTEGEKNSFSSSAYMKNFRVTEKRALKKRCGYKKLADGIVCDSCFKADIKGEEYFIYKNGSMMRALRFSDMKTYEFDAGDGARPGYFTFGGVLYAVGGGICVKFDGDGFSFAEPYIPTVAITCSPSGAGTSNESMNILSNKAKISYSPDGQSTEYILPSAASGVVSVEDGDETVPGSAYTYDPAAHKLTFTSAPAGGVPDSLTVVFTISDGIMLNMPYIGNRFTIYGGDRDTRVFAYGNKNVIYYSDVGYNGAEPLYFPADNFITVGDGCDVTALIRHYDRLMIFTTRETWFITMTNVTVNGVTKPAFPLSPLNSVVGCAGGGAVYADNSPVSLSNDGIYVFSQSTVRDERNARRISDRVSSYLTPSFLKYAQVYDNERGKEIWMCFDGTALIYNYGINVFYCYDKINAGYLFGVNGRAAFYSGGAIYVFDESCTTDDGEPIEAIAESGTVVLDRTVKKRRLKRICASYLIADGAVTVSAVPDRGNVCSAEFTGSGSSGFDFGGLDFGHLGFECSDKVIHDERRAQLSSFESLKMRIECRGDGDVSVSSVTFIIDGA